MSGTDGPPGQDSPVWFPAAHRKSAGHLQDEHGGQAGETDSDDPHDHQTNSREDVDTVANKDISDGPNGFLGDQFRARRHGLPPRVLLGHHCGGEQPHHGERAQPPPLSQSVVAALTALSATAATGGAARRVLVDGEVVGRYRFASRSRSSGSCGGHSLQDRWQTDVLVPEGDAWQSSSTR